MQFLKYVGVLWVIVLLSACGGGGGQVSGNSKSSNSNNSSLPTGNNNGDADYKISLDVTSLSFTKMTNESIKLTTEVKVTFSGDGVLAGFAPDVTAPYWLDVVTVSSTATSAVFSVSIPAFYVLQPDHYHTSIRFITGKQDGTKVVYVDLPISVFVDEPFAVVNDPLEFWVLGSQAQEVMPKNGITLWIRGGESEWSISADASWVKISKAKGKGAAGVIITADPSLASSGINNATLTVTEARSGTIKSIPIRFEVKEKNSGTPVTASQPFIFDFNVTDIMLNPASDRMYISDNANRKLYLVNKKTGLTEKYFSFDLYPHQIAVSLDGKKLYVTLLPQELNSYSWNDKTSRVAIIDAENEVLVDEFRLKFIPGDLIVTGNNELILGGSYEQNSTFHIFNATTGELKQTPIISVSAVTNMKLLPSGKSFYYAMIGQSPPPITRFDLGLANPVYIEPVASPHGDWLPNNDFWIDAAGTYGLTKEGDVFKTADSAHVKRITNAYVYINAAAFDPDKKRVVILTTEDKLIEFDAETWDQRKVLSEYFTDIETLMVFNSQIYVLRKNNTGYRLDVLGL